MSSSAAPGSDDAAHAHRELRVAGIAPSRDDYAARPGWNTGLYAHMRRVLATERGGELYRKR
jgi:hypothetical protein